MSITKTPFGQLPCGTAVTKYTLSGENGLAVSILDYGATLQAIEFAGKDVLLGYENAADYVRAGGFYMGATVGRYANRIAGGKFTLNGVAYNVTKNENGKTQLHGGAVGFDKKMWDMEIIDAAIPTLRATTTAAHGEEGFPGNMEIAVTFSVTADNTLSIRYNATSDKDTVANFTNHAYFNLNGYDGGDILDTEVIMDAYAYTPADGDLIPTGEIRPVDGTPFDMRTQKTWGEVILCDHPEIKACDGVDHNFVIADKAGELRRAMYAKSPKSGIAVTCCTDLPGIQIYTANTLKMPFGKGGPMTKYQGFCMETQFFPDSPNHPQFPSTVLKAGETFETVTTYTFEKV